MFFSERLGRPSFSSPRSYTVKAMKRSLRQIAEAIGARLIGDGSVEVGSVASIESASPADLVFVTDEKHLAEALRSRAGAVIAGEFAEKFAASRTAARPLLINHHPK